MKKNPPDILVLKQARKALMQSTSKETLAANLDYLMDYFLIHPAAAVKEKFEKPQETTEQHKEST